MRQGNKLPIGHITARSVASWIHLQQVETALGERELGHPTFRNKCIYRLQVQCQNNYTEDEMAARIYNRPCWHGHATAVPYHNPFKSGAELERHLGWHAAPAKSQHLTVGSWAGGVASRRPPWCRHSSFAPRLQGDVLLSDSSNIHPRKFTSKLLGDKNNHAFCNFLSQH